MDCSPPAPLSIGFSRQEYWSRLPFTSSGDLPNPGTKPTSPTLAGRFFTTEPPGKNPSPWGQELAISISLLKRGRRRTGGKKSSLALHRSGNCQDPCPPGLSLRSGFGCKCGLQSHVAWVRFWCGHGSAGGLTSLGLRLDQQNMDSACLRGFFKGLNGISNVNAGHTALFEISATYMLAGLMVSFLVWHSGSSTNQSLLIPPASCIMSPSLYTRALHIICLTSSLQNAPPSACWYKTSK